MKRLQKSAHLVCCFSKVGGTAELVSKSEEEAEVLSNQLDVESCRQQEQKEVVLDSRLDRAGFFLIELKQ